MSEQCRVVTIEIRPRNDECDCGEMRQLVRRTRASFFPPPPLCLLIASFQQAISSSSSAAASLSLPLTVCVAHYGGRGFFCFSSRPCWSLLFPLLLLIALLSLLMLKLSVCISATVFVCTLHGSLVTLELLGCSSALVKHWCRVRILLE